MLRIKISYGSSDYWSSVSLYITCLVGNYIQPVEYMPAGGGATRACESVTSAGVCAVAVLCIAAAGKAQ